MIGRLGLSVENVESSNEKGVRKRVTNLKSISKC